MIKVSSLSKYYGKSIGVKDLNFEINDGEIFAFLGPNGAGKTTTIRLITGMIGPTRGTAYIDDLDVSRKENLSDVHRRVGILPEVPGHYESLSAYRNLQFYGRMYGMGDEASKGRIEELMKEFELWERRNDSVATYSKGMKQKLAIIRAVLHDPRFVFLDEPLSGLDPEAASFVRNYMIKMRNDGKTVVLSTHDLNDADRLSDRVAVVKNQLLAVDSPASLKLKTFKRTVVFHLKSAEGIDQEEISGFDYVNSLEIKDDKLVIEIESPEQNNPDLAEYLMNHGFRIQFIGEIKRSLEDVYMNIVRKNGEEAS